MEMVWKLINPGLKAPEYSKLEFTFSKGFFSYLMSWCICYPKHAGLNYTKSHCTTWKKKLKNLLLGNSTHCLIFL